MHLKKIQKNNYNDWNTFVDNSKQGSIFSKGTHKIKKYSLDRIANQVLQVYKSTLKSIKGRK